MCVLYFTHNLASSDAFLLRNAAIESSSSVPKLRLRWCKLSAPAAAAPGTVKAALDTENRNLNKLHGINDRYEIKVYEIEILYSISKNYKISRFTIMQIVILYTTYYWKWHIIQWSSFKKTRNYSKCV